MDAENLRGFEFAFSPRRQNNWIMLLFGFCFVFIMMVINATPALAHSRVEVGPYVVILGWEVEPVIVGERNAIFLEVTRDDAPVEGVEASLDVVVLYAGRTYTANLSPTDVPGIYHADIFPTVKGQYEVHLTGFVGDTSIDEVLEPEEVLSSSIIAFPEALPEVRDLESQIADMDARLGTANTLAVGGILVGLLGLFLAIFALRRIK